MKNINFYFDERIKIEDKMRLIKDNGFDGIFLMCDDNFDVNVKLANNHNLYIESAHLPYRDICNTLWLDNDIGEKYVLSTIDWIKRISEANIKIAVMHLASSPTPPKMNELGFVRLSKIIKCCEEYNIILAMENIRDWNYVFKALEKLNSKNAKICFDLGHANCFTKNIYQLDYKKIVPNIVCLHIHDNFGEKDEHLIPFDGNIEYDFILEKLKKYGFNGCLTLELECEYLYNDCNYYIKKAKKALDKIEELYEKV